MGRHVRLRLELESLVQTPCAVPLVMSRHVRSRLVLESLVQKPRAVSLVKSFKPSGT